MSRRAGPGGARRSAVAGAALVIAAGLIAGGCWAAAAERSEQTSTPGGPRLAVPARPGG